MPIAATSRVSVTTPHPLRRAGDIVVDKAVESVALTPTEPVSRVVPASLRLARPDASFITHLIATAEQVPQTRVLRRAAALDVDAAYRAAAAYGAGSLPGRVSRII